jgi:hypothetical protein
MPQLISNVILPFVQSSLLAQLKARYIGCESLSILSTLLVICSLVTLLTLNTNKPKHININNHLSLYTTLLITLSKKC